MQHADDPLNASNAHHVLSLIAICHSLVQPTPPHIMAGVTHPPTAHPRPSRTRIAPVTDVPAPTDMPKLSTNASHHDLDPQSDTFSNPRLRLVRHAQTPPTKKKRWCSWRLVELSQMLNVTSGVHGDVPGCCPNTQTKKEKTSSTHSSRRMLNTDGEHDVV